MKKESEMNSLLFGFGSRKAGALLLTRRSVDATPSGENKLQKQETTIEELKLKINEMERRYL